MCSIADAGTVRRFLEQYGDSIDSVVFVVDALNDGIYQASCFYRICLFLNLRF